MPFYLTTTTKDGMAEEVYDHAIDRDKAYRDAMNSGTAHALMCPKADLTERTEEIKVTPQERDMIIAALRLWQGQDHVDPFLIDIAENGRGHGGMLRDDQIDTLIEEVINV